MDTKKMGSFISKKRKEKEMTQKELAKVLNVTDKAVSKWERGMSYPDVALLVPLAEALDVTTTQLLKGEAEDGGEEDANSAVIETIAYAQKSFKRTLRIKEGAIIGILTIMCLAAMLACSICDVAVNSRFSWSLIVAGGIVIGWTVIVPVVKWKWRGLMLGLISVSILTIPYLYLIERLLPSKGWFKPAAMPIAVISIIFLWLLYLIFRMKRLSIWSKLAALCLMGGGMTLVTNLIARRFAHQPWLTVEMLLNISIEVIFAMILIVIGMLRRNRRLQDKGQTEDNVQLQTQEKEGVFVSEVMASKEEKFAEKESIDEADQENTDKVTEE